MTPAIASDDDRYRTSRPVVVRRRVHTNSDLDVVNSVDVDSPPAWSDRLDPPVGLRHQCCGRRLILNRRRNDVSGVMAVLIVMAVGRVSGGLSGVRAGNVRVWRGSCV